MFAALKRRSTGLWLAASAIVGVAAMIGWLWLLTELIWMAARWLFSW